MIRKKSNFTQYSGRYFKPQSSSTSTCALPLESSLTSAPSLEDHKSLCFSLVDGLVWRGLFSSAQQVIQRIISTSPSASDAISAADFGASRGVDLGRGVCAALIRKLIESGEPNWARAFYNDHVVGRGIIPDSNTVNSMVICLAKLGDLDEAITLFRRLVESDDFVPCKAACNSIVRGFLKQDMVLDAVDWLIGIRGANVQLNNRYYHVLIERLCDKGYMDEAMEVFDIMQGRSGSVPTLRSFKLLFYGLCKRGWAVEAEFLSGEMESKGFFVDKVMYTSLMNAYSKDKKMKMAMRVYLRMLKMGCEVDNYTYNTLIHGFAKMGLFDKAQLLLNQMNELGMQPDVVTYNVMISNYCRRGEVHCAAKFLDSMFGQNLHFNVHCYTSLIAALYKVNKCNEASELFKTILKMGVVPDYVLFFILMKNNKGHELPLSFSMLQAIAKNGCGLDPSALPGSANTNTTLDLEQESDLLLGEIAKKNLNLANVAVCIYISALCEVGNTDAAIAYLEKLVSVDCRLLLYVYNCFIKRLCQDGHFEYVKSLIDTMQEQGVIPNLSTYLIMVNEYCKRKDMEAVYDILAQMKDRGLKPNVAIYDSIIGCLGKERKMLEAEAVFKRMLESGVDPDEISYLTMISAYSRNGRALEALELFDMMIERAIKPSSYSYTSLITVLVKRGMIDMGCLYLCRMLEDGFLPTEALYTSVFSHSVRKGEFEFAFRLFNLMERNHIEAGVILYIGLVSGICRKITNVNARLYEENKFSMKAREILLYLLRERSLLPSGISLRVPAFSAARRKYFALKLLQKMEGVGFMPNLYLYNVIISGYCWGNMMEDAYNQLGLMQRQGIQPNEVTFTILINAHIRAGEIDSAVGLFNMMNEHGCGPDDIMYAALLRGICRAGRALDALSLLYAMQKRGFFPSKASYENVLHCLCGCYLSIPSFRVFEEMITHDYVPGLYFRNWLLCILCEQKKLQEAHKVLDMLLERGKSPDGYALRLLEETSYKQRELEFTLHG